MSTAMDRAKMPVSDVAFRAAVEPTMEQVVRQLDAGGGVKDPKTLVQVLVAQALVETGRRPTGCPTPAGEPVSLNLTGIFRGSRLETFAGLPAFVRAEVAALSLPFYRQVLAAEGVVEIAQALGRSPWDASGHYAPKGGQPGEVLIELVRELYGAQPAEPPPTTAPSGGSFLAPAGESVRITEEGDRLRVDPVAPSGGGVLL